MIVVEKYFEEMEQELMTNEQPSLYLATLPKLPWFREAPFAMLYALTKTEQSPIHHPEGSAWNHTLLVVDQAAKVKEESTNSRAFMWAALLHDIGKPTTTRNRKGKITSYDHDRVGAQLAREFLNVFSLEEPLIEYICSLVRWHMMILYVTKDLSFGDKTAMKKEVNLQDISLLGFCDRMGRTNADAQKEKETIRLFEEKVKL